MKATEFKKLIETKDPKKIIYMYIDGKISLNGYQIDKVLKLKNEQSKRKEV